MGILKKGFTEQNAYFAEGNDYTYWPEEGFTPHVNGTLLRLQAWNSDVITVTIHLFISASMWKVSLISVMAEIVREH